MPAFCCTLCSTIYSSYFLNGNAFMRTCVALKGEGCECNVTMMLIIANFICKQPIRCVL